MFFLTLIIWSCSLLSQDLRHHLWWFDHVSYLHHHNLGGHPPPSMENHHMPGNFMHLLAPNHCQYSIEQQSYSSSLDLHKNINMGFKSQNFNHKTSSRYINFNNFKACNNLNSHLVLTSLLRKKRKTLDKEAGKQT